MKALVTGGTGLLGRLTAQSLVHGRACNVAVMSRGGGAPFAGIEARRADLVSSAGLEEAVAGTDAVIWCTHDREAHANGALAMRNLLAACKAAGVQHLVYSGIAGIETSASSPYYAGKLAEEEALRTSGLPHTILRATQFHTLVETVLEACDEGDRLRIPKPLMLRPVDPQVVAGRLAELAFATPEGRAADLAGPEDVELADLAAIWLRVRAQLKPIETVAEAPVRWQALQTLTRGPADRAGPDFETWLRAQTRS